MIIVDTALERRHEEGNPVRIGLVGAGYMGRGITLQIQQSMIGMDVVAIANRTVSEAERTYREADVDDAEHVTSQEELERALAAGHRVFTNNPQLLCRASNIDAIVEVTGEVEAAAHVVMGAIENRKHVVLVNAELDATVGPILKWHADRAGVVITNADGDEPGVTMNLYRFVKAIGYRPVMAGNVKGFLNNHRNPDTQRSFADQHGQRAKMVTSFADGTKLAMEGAVLANGTGLRIGTRGMDGHKCNHVKEVLDLYSVDELLDGGRVDYLLGAEPGSGGFVVGYNDHPEKQKYMKYFKMGDGPLYLFYRPFHLTHLEAPLSIARAVLFSDATIAPRGGPVADVLTVAKRDLGAGDVLDGIGGFTCYGMIDNAETTTAQNLLPMGLADGCRLLRDVPADQPITYADVEVPEGRLADRLRAQQHKHFGLPQPPMPVHRWRGDDARRPVDHRRELAHNQAAESVIA
jgi:predicted homoserine dehydrogenase-like protein